MTSQWVIGIVFTKVGCYLSSENKKAISWKLVIAGLII
jgi:nucleoside permease NupC